MKIIPKFRTGNELKAKEKWDTWFEDYRVLMNLDSMQHKKTGII